MDLPLLIDTDPGIDDALALLLALASPEVRVVGLTTVFGNHTVVQTTHNARQVLMVAGRGEVPVTPGAARPLAAYLDGPRTPVPGRAGLGGAAGRAPAAPPADAAGGAAEAMVSAAREHPGKLTLLALGPLTNLALALRREPNLPRLVRRVFVMGGAVFCPGNVTPAAEANFHHDPDAAAAVLTAGWPLTLVGLDVTTRTVLAPAELAALAQAGAPPGDLIGRMVPTYLESYRRRHGLDGIPTHDPSAAACVVRPGLFTTRRARVRVETSGHNAGQVVPGASLDRPEVDVCVEVDSAGLRALLRERLGPREAGDGR